MKRLLRRIKGIYGRRGKLGDLWRWATRVGNKGQVKRWKALKTWAARHEALALEEGRNAAARRWHAIRLVYWRKYRRKLRWLKQHQHQNEPPSSTGSLVNFDGHLVARWMVEEALKPARASGRWKGVVFSGYRDPAYSTSLCVNMCGHPTCPGQCAGASSNHSCPPSHKGVPFEGAVDVTDTWGLQGWCADHGYPIRHTLPNDLPHFSRTGQ